MEEFKLTMEEMKNIAERLQIPLDDETLDATKEMMEGWINDAHDVSREIRKEKYDGIFPASITKL